MDANKVLIPIPNQYKNLRDNLRLYGYELVAFSDRYDLYLDKVTDCGTTSRDRLRYLKQHNLFGIFRILSIDATTHTIIIDKPLFLKGNRIPYCFAENEVLFKVSSFIEHIKPLKARDLIPDNFVSAFFAIVGAPVVIPMALFFGGKSIVDRSLMSFRENKFCKNIDKIPDIPQFKSN